MKIVINGLKKSFKGQTILDGVDLVIPEGKTTVIIGPSGTGKSVMIKHILGLIKPDGGEILIDGKDVTKLNDIELNEIRKNFGVCFQDAALFDSMSVGENVGFPYKVHTKMNKNEVDDRVSELLKEVGLSGIQEKLPSQLSGGMRKRVGLARAIAMDPKILLFDEPTTGLDPVMSNAINILIKEVQKKTKATSLVISHDIHGALMMADLMAMLYKGRIVFSGEPDDFIDTKDPLIRQYMEGGIEGPINPIR
ncbi:MAG TPA: ABC transporter ATP-binding protein [Desulfomonilia bacterium]|jgi:phospholipid/cholesterol/gamma-HCH transport system ATP-binding protein